MNINKHNYEAFFLDYHEGNLTPQQVADLLLFVEQHSELKREFENFENVMLEDYSDYSFENKEGLKKNLIIDNNNREEYFIRSVEGALNKAEENLLTDFIKQHPQFSTELDLFKKTKLQADTSVVFENKEQLKDIAVTADYLLIASVEGLLSNQEISMLHHQADVDAEMKNNLSLYKQTKLVADNNIVFENKEELKRKERKIIPIYYYVAAAAAILLLFGIFSLFLTNSTEAPGLANGKVENPGLEVKTENKNNVIQVGKNSPNTNTAELNTSVAKKYTANKSIPNTRDKDSLKVNATNQEQENKNLATNTPEMKDQAIVVEQPVIAENKQEINTNNQAPAIASVDPKKAEKKEKQEEFLSLAQMATKKIKEKTLDTESYASEKKNDKLKKISGWDVLQVVAKGVSKVTGKKVEVKPTYNDEGDVTAYALGAGGFEFSKGK